MHSRNSSRGIFLYVKNLLSLSYLENHIPWHQPQIVYNTTLTKKLNQMISKIFKNRGSNHDVGLRTFYALLCVWLLMGLCAASKLVYTIMHIKGEIQWWCYCLIPMILLLLFIVSVLISDENPFIIAVSSVIMALIIGLFVGLALKHEGVSDEIFLMSFAFTILPIIWIGLLATLWPVLLSRIEYIIILTLVFTIGVGLYLYWFQHTTWRYLLMATISGIITFYISYMFMRSNSLERTLNTLFRLAAAMFLEPLRQFTEMLEPSERKKHFY